jgi:dCTP deaminase
MFFSDEGLRRILDDGDLVVTPLLSDAIRPASITLHLAAALMDLQTTDSPVDPLDEATYPVPRHHICGANGFIIPPKGFLLGATIEKVALSKNIVGHLSNISGLARLGLTVAMSTHIAPGFGYGCPRQLTLEIYNASTCSILLRPKMRICHLLLSKLETTSIAGYDQLFPQKYSGDGPGTSEYSSSDSD